MKQSRISKNTNETVFQKQAVSYSKKYKNAIKKNFLIIGLLLFVTVSVFTSCEKELNKVVKRTFPDGSPATIFYYDGEQKQELLVRAEMFHANGQMKTIKRYDDGKQNGYAESWYEDGTPWSKMMYKDGKMIGDYFNNHPNGRVKLKGRYEKGLKYGDWIQFSESGDTISIETHKDGRLIGRKRFDANKK